MLYLARGIEDERYWVVEEVGSALVDSSWRLEPEDGGWRLSHADDDSLSAAAFALGGFSTPDDAVAALRAFTGDS